MPPMRDSRFEHCRAIRDDAGNLYLTEREPYRFRPLPDTRIHTVAEGETLYTIAGRYFRPRPRACGLWWIIADFQPDPILDPTLALEPGRRLFITSLRVVEEEILGPRRVAG
ncbi:MAG TPA: LysM domain-containing protein [Haliangium sp.]|nr:LysM domain-containing protein [Haliangium sp.]